MSEPSPVVESVTVTPDEDPRKGYYGPSIVLLLHEDGSVSWEYEEQ